MEILDIDFKERETVITIFILPEMISTSRINNFSEKLFKILPSLGNHFCINESNNDFAHELKNTELAHVLEHILMELIGKKDKEVKKISGLTSWNWRKEGNFIYKIRIDYSKKTYFKKSLSEALSILNDLYKQPIVTKRSFRFLEAHN